MVDEDRLEELKNEIPELPNVKLKRYMTQYGLPYFDANLLTENVDKAKFFEDCMALERCQPKNVSNWLLGDVSRILNEKNIGLDKTSLTPDKLCDMIALIEKKTISNTAGKTVLEEIIFSDKTADDVVKEKGLAQISDSSALEGIVQQVLEANAKVVADYKGGKSNAGLPGGSVYASVQGTGQSHRYAGTAAESTGLITPAVPLTCNAKASPKLPKKFRGCFLFVR